MNLTLSRLPVAVSFFLTIFSITVSSVSGQEKAPASGGNDLIMMSVSVWNSAEQHVKGLNREAFDLTDENVKRPIEFFENADSPISVGVLIDTSESLHRVRSARLAAPTTISEVIARFLELGHPSNQYFLMSFNRTPRLLVDWSSRQPNFSQAIHKEERKGDTAMYDACFAAIEKLRTASSTRRVLLLISDGYDDRSKRTFKDLRNVLRESDIVFYGIGVFPESFSGSMPTEGQGVLDGLTEITGGKTIAIKDRKEMLMAAGIIATELRHQYRIGFRPDPSDQPNKWRRIKIKVIAPPDAARESRKLFVRAREGYYTH